MTQHKIDSYDSMSIIARQPTWLETQMFHMENQLNPNFCQGLEPLSINFFVKDLKDRTPYNLFLDDYRSPSNVIGYAHSIGIRPDLYVKNKWDTVIDYNHFVETITERGLPKIVSFDHDLADEAYIVDWDNPEATANLKEKTGMDCAKWLIDYCIDNNKALPEYYVHSMNPVGRKNIQMLLDNYREYERAN